MNLLRERVNKSHQLTDESWSKFAEIFRTERYDSNHKIVEIGKQTSEMYFLLNGIVRAYSVTKRNKEINSLIFAEGNFFADYSSLIKNRPPNLNLETLTEVKIMTCSFKDFISLTDRYLDINIMYRKHLEKFYLSLEKRDKELAILNSTDRFLALKKRIPKIELLVSQKHIASHLGISPVQLSRLKKELYHL